MEIKYKYHDAFGLRRTMIAEDDNPNDFKTFTELDLEDILKGIEWDRELQVAGSANKTLARVPLTIYEQSIHEHWGDKEWKTWLNDPQNEPFRIWKGRV